MPLVRAVRVRVLAGPGSGKTRILVHRVAWLLRCQRVRAKQILVVCYTRANALELRTRLFELVGRDALGVTIKTLHGVALTMVGVHRILPPKGDLTLERLIPEATAMLRGEQLDDGQQSRQRDALLRGFSYLFIDEYQDIDGEKYALLSALAGRTLQGDQRKLRVFAVGDDDQAIYTWDGASTDFIRRFEADYHASRFVVPHSYRTPAGILELAQNLIRALPDRLKQGHELTVNPDRLDDPPAGPWATEHPDLKGRIVWHRAISVAGAADHAMQLIRDWIEDGVPAETIGCLTPTRPSGLTRLRLAAERHGVPFSWPLPSGQGLPLTRVREVTALFDALEDAEDHVDGKVLASVLDRLDDSPWRDGLRKWLEPHIGRRLHRHRWRQDLVAWARLERRACTVGNGVHLGTVHGAKGLEFDHVFVLDDGTLGRDPRRREEEHRLLYVALTRARKSLQILSTDQPSGPFRELRHPLLEVRDLPMLVADGPPEYSYDVLGPADIWLDWLGRQDGRHPAHAALEAAQFGDAFDIVVRGRAATLQDAAGQAVAVLSQTGRSEWLPRRERSLKLRLLGVTREYAEAPGRTDEYRRLLQRGMWWTGVWEGRWRR